MEVVLFHMPKRVLTAAHRIQRLATFTTRCVKLTAKLTMYGLGPPPPSPLPPAFMDIHGYAAATAAATLSSFIHVLRVSLNVLFAYLFLVGYIFIFMRHIDRIENKQKHKAYYYYYYYCFQFCFTVYFPEIIAG